MMSLEARFSRFIADTRRPSIILGSSSSSRRQIMDTMVKQHGFTYTVMAADLDESDPAYRKPAPRDLVLSLARAKRDALIQRHRESLPPADFSGLLITCDQVVVCEGKILEKPESIEQAREFITGYNRSPAVTVGSTIVTNMSTGSSVECVDETSTTFSGISAECVEALLAEGEVMWCAGALMVENPILVPFMTSMEGGMDAVMGLSKESVMKGILEVCSFD